MAYMTDEQRTKCHVIIHTASTTAAAVGAGLAQIPCSDAVPIGAVQVSMVISLGAVFGISFDERSAKSTLVPLLGTTIGRGLSQLLVGWIPGFGNIINASTAAAVTESIGWTLATDFAGRPATAKR